MNLDLLTPNGTVIKNGAFTDLVVPTIKGEINILEGHTHLVTRLSNGIVSMKNQEGKQRYFSVSHGLCKVLGGKVSILSMTSESAESIDIERAEKALERAKKKLSGEEILSDVDLIKQQRKLERAETRLKLAYLRNA